MRRWSWCGPRHRRVEVLLVPELRAERIVLVHVHVVEALGRMVAGVLDQGVVRTLHVAEAAAASRLDAGGLGLGDLRLRSARHAARARPGVAADEDRAALVRGVERQELTSGRREYVSRLLRVSVTCQPKCQSAVCGDVGGAAADLREQDQHVVRRRERREAAPARLRAGRELLARRRRSPRPDRRSSDADDGSPVPAACRSLLSEPGWPLEPPDLASNEGADQVALARPPPPCSSVPRPVASEYHPEITPAPEGGPCRPTDRTRRGRSARA